MTFYDDEEIEENENLEEDQSEEDELAEGEQDENDAESDTNESENQSEETDDSSSKGTMKGNRHLHGNRQKQIKKLKNRVRRVNLPFLNGMVGFSHGTMERARRSRRRDDIKRRNSQ